MTKLTTHALDIYSGRPAKGMKVDVYFISDKKEKIKSIVLNDDGRSDEPMVDGIKVGNYLLEFHVGDYYQKIIQLKKPTFLDKVPVSFYVVNSQEKYHVPLIFSPSSFQSYRGS